MYSPVCKIPDASAQQKSSVPIIAIKFNPKKPDILAVGDEEGNVTVWRLNTSLAERKERELSFMNSLASANDSKADESTE